MKTDVSTTVIPSDLMRLGRGVLALFAPPKAAPDDTRPAHDVLAAPHFMLHDPAALHFPQAMRPVVPGNGGYISCGLGSVAYDHQAKWDRHAVCQAGPVREFFDRLMNDVRVKHV